MNLKKIIKYWDKDAETRVELKTSDLYINQEKILDIFFKYVPRLNKSKKVLDAGCGDGRLSIIIAQEEYKVIGVDFSSKMVKTAKSRVNNYPYVYFMIGDLCNLPFINQSFDIIVNCDVIEHIFNKKKLVKEFNRILKPDGIVILSTPNPFSIIHTIARTSLLHVGHKDDYEWLVSPFKLKKLFLQMGFECLYHSGGGYFFDERFEKPIELIREKLENTFFKLMLVYNFFIFKKQFNRKFVKMRKVCMIVQHSFSPPHCRTYDEAQILSKNEYQVAIIATGNKTLPKEEKLEYAKILRVFNDGFYRLKIPIFNNPLLITRLFIKALKVNADIYHVYDMHNILVGVLLKIAGKKVIYDVGDDYPSYNNYPSFIQSIIRRLEGFCSKFYDIIITLTDSLRKDRLKYNSNIKTMYYCPNHSFSPIVSNNKREKDYILVYEGGIGEKKGINIILESLVLVLRRIKNVKLLLIGEVDKKEKDAIETKIAKNNLSDYVKFVGMIPYTDVGKYINMGDIGLVLLQPWSYSYIVSVPNKLIDYMACGKPVIASRGFFEIERIVKNADCGILVDHNDAKQVSDAIFYLLQKDIERIRMGKNAREYTEKYHNWKLFGKTLLEIYDLFKKERTKV